MKEFKGTKGEWHAVEYANYTDIQNGEYYEDLSILDIDNFPEEEVKANVKLIVAAPDLLKALQKIVDAQYNPDKTLANLNSEISNARNVINKALD